MVNSSLLLNGWSRRYPTFTRMLRSRSDGFSFQLHTRAVAVVATLMFVMYAERWLDFFAADGALSSFRRGEPWYRLSLLHQQPALWWYIGICSSAGLAWERTRRICYVICQP